MSQASDRLWRYLSLTKFLSLLEERALYFTRSDKFEDPLEGRYPTEVDPSGEFVRLTTRGTLASGEEFGIKLLGGQPIRTVAHSMRKYTIVNCWHHNPSESDAMWKLYLDSPDGVAVESSLSRLALSFDAETRNRVHIRPVAYLDYDEGEPPANNALDPFFHKRKAYEHERELRVLMPFFHPHGVEVTHGALIPVDLEQLIQVVHVAPKAQRWFVKLIPKILRRYGLDKPVRHSTLLQTPG